MTDSTEPPVAARPERPDATAEPAERVEPDQPPEPDGGSGGMDPGEYLRVIGLGALVGIPAALLAAGFLGLVHEIEHWLWDVLPEHLGATEPPWYLVVGLPLVGAVVVWAARRFLPGDGGHEPIGGINVAPTPMSHGVGIALAAIGTLAFGLVLGPEAPLIALGSVAALAVTSFTRLDQRSGQLVATAGSFSAISALFGGPLVAGMLMLEAGIGLGAALLPILLPGLVAAAVGYVVFVGLGDWAGLSTTPLTIPGLPEYSSVRIIDLVLATVIGVVAALLIGTVHRGAAWLLAQRPRLTMGVWLLLGGLATGLLALLARALGGDSQAVLFSGQAALPDFLHVTSAWVVLVVVVCKALGYAICLGVGFRGGPVFPAIFLGVGVAELLGWAFDMSPTAAVAIGAACGMAAGTRLVFASLILSALLVGSEGADAIPDAVLATVAAWLVVNMIERRRAAAGIAAPTAAA